MDINTIFADLVPLPRWVPYRLVWNPEREKFDKIPHQGRHGLSTRSPEDWMDAGKAMMVADANQLAGIGIVMTAGLKLGEERLIGLDYDDVQFDDFKPLITGYSEVSPSGGGVRQFAWVPEHWAARFADTLNAHPDHCHHAEIYVGSSPRFLTVTGNVIEQSPIPHLDPSQLAILTPLMKPAENAAPVQLKLPPTEGVKINLKRHHLTKDQEDLLAGIGDIDRSKVVRGLIIKLIDAGEKQGDILATITQTEPLWRYCMDHRNNIDTRALLFAREEIGRAYEASLTGKKEKLMNFAKKDEPAPELGKTKIDYAPFPVDLYHKAPGLVGEIARWIMKASFSPREEFAYACALSMTACLIGPYCTVTLKSNRSSKLNLYITLVGKTSSGKNEAMDPMTKLMSATDAKDIVLDFPASEAALRRQLSLTPNILIRVDELAHKLESMQGNSNGSGLGRAILEGYNGARMPEKVYADDRKNLPAVENPFMQILSGTTEKVWEVLKSTHMDDGTINRFIFVCLPEVPCYSRNLDADDTITLEFKDRLNKFWRDGKRYDLLGKVPSGYGRHIATPPDVLMAYVELDQRAHSLISTRAYGPVFARYSQHVLKIAAILAVGDDRKELTMDDFNMAKQFMEWCLTNTYAGVETYMSDTPFEKQSKKLLAWMEKEGGKVRLRDAYKKLHLSRRDMDSLIESLTYSCELEQVEDTQERDWLQLRTGKAD